MNRPARSYRRSARGGVPLAAVLVALMAIGPASAVAPRLAQAVSSSVNEEEVGHQYVETRRCVRPLVGPPPARPARPADRARAVVHISHPVPIPQLLSPARGLDGPHLRC